jgi:hypothetical protein
MTEVTAKEILTALFDDVLEGFARLGCGMIGLPYPYVEDEHESK